MDEGEVLRQLVEDKIVVASGMPLGVAGVAAARLLADMYAAGLAHGITPQDWAWVTALPDACWDVSRALARQHEQLKDQLHRLNESLTVVPPPVVARMPWDQPYPAPPRSSGAAPPSPGRRGPSR